ncbi:MAG TPA: 1,4-alpha-glucan branching protein GlgB [Amaricoccus sp.]|uniref:1,4-alpha-glucan branching protein GlgB n=1 Tax=Amaricoccus sp. TaxID=1872485 RepID=UPI002BB39CC8|nr:1,4-alpha-glucan branching protein GlgB [Amaricoccus sp.]HMQ95233.1 1,4-alpha-glucan branching protein GlgB [Amaricoccus sp.]HMR53565.1 1,4-alpha-glucan branching protein GlgB [Amaricoccus sp.]HMR60114.1 1,4-alpha-glucan branching protein GlgB [Amaricoccus sp.]HMU00546.1 1,4-alpha-glucan branching protein GlgB [Amaricoccus sp.]
MKKGQKKPAAATEKGASRLDDATVAAIVTGTHPDPFAVLGLQGEGRLTARAFIDGAEEVEAFTLAGKSAGTLERRHPAGFFEGPLRIRKRQPLKYRARNAGGEWWVIDPYSFGPVLGPMDDYYIGEGSHLRLFDKLGAHPIHHEGAEGVHFAVWAPNARRVSVVGPFNAWDGRRHVMRLRQDTGIWEIFLPEVAVGAPYKYEIVGRDGVRLPLKADPFARASEFRPATASVVAPWLDHDWGDAAHREFWAAADARRQPVSIYEVHAGSWARHDDGRFLSWDELGERLIPYVVDMGFTHIEFLPVAEHPYDPSWGYQTTGLFAPSARFGPPEGFARFVDGAHRAGIGIILDWVPAHFPTDAHGLGRFDGTALYEHADPRQGFHPDWNTLIYNFGRREVVSFLVNNALYWSEKFHIDGLRVDAVASMLYLDYSRKEGEWIPNRFGGRENLEAVEFLQAANRAVYASHPGTMMIAEESTSWPKVSAPVHEGGLGFGFKWNMGFMHDTLQYMARDPIHRRYHHNDLTFGLLYAFSENFVLPLSHDEVVHGKGSLIAKMSGDPWQKFANLRAYYAFMWGYPGKKLIFMGQEFAQGREWSEARGLDWEQTGIPAHKGVQDLMRDLNRLYRDTPALHARDCEGEGFEWLLADESRTSVYAWIRKAPEAPPVAVIANFTPVPHQGYRVPLPAAGRWREILNTDAAPYGGSGMGNLGGVLAAEDPQGIAAPVNLPPLATLWLEFDPAS